MNNPIRVPVLALALAAMSGSPAAAQTPPEPLPMGVPYQYQYGNPYWFRTLPYSPYPLAANPPYYYPFGATGPIYGRYSWDYNVHFTGSGGWYPVNVPIYYHYYHPNYTYNRAWTSRGW